MEGSFGNLISCLPSDIYINCIACTVGAFFIWFMGGVDLFLEFDIGFFGIKFVKNPVVMCLHLTYLFLGCSLCVGGGFSPHRAHQGPRTPPLCFNLGRVCVADLALLRTSLQFPLGGLNIGCLIPIKSKGCSSQWIAINYSLCSSNLRQSSFLWFH